MTRNGTAFQLPTLAPLTDETESSLLPTPAAAPYGNNQGGGMGRVGPVRYSLESMARRNLWPTPTARDWKDGTAATSAKVPANGLLGRVVHQRTPSSGGGVLNPEFCEWLMGFPIGWSALDASATQSYRKSRKSSGARSSRRRRK
jgi:hypothetical protein